MPAFFYVAAICAATALAQPLAQFTLQQRTVLPWLTPLQKLGGGDPLTLASACLNGTSGPPPPCTWSPPKSNYYLPGCASGSLPSSVNCIHFDTLAEAQAACAADSACGGVTSQDGGVPPWELRRGPNFTFSSLGEISYQITNAPACHATSRACNAFTTDGSLYHCPGGRCDCDAGAEVCARGRDIFSLDPAIGFGAATTDLYVLSGTPPPPEWEAAIASGTLLYASPEPPPCYWPEVGNGYLATVPGWASMHVGGLFNGACGTTTKARLPSPVALGILGGKVTGGALDTLAGVLLRRWVLGDGVTEVIVRNWAHRTRPHVLVVDVELYSGSQAAFNTTTLWNPQDQGGGEGDGCAGGFSVDIAFGPQQGNGAPALWSGATILASDTGERPNVTVALDPLPGFIHLTPAAPRARFLAAVATSIDYPGGTAPSDTVAGAASGFYAEAAALSWEALWAEHSGAWGALNGAGIDVEPASADPGDVARARDIGAHARSSQYFLFSSLREDHFPGISPGGLSTQNYQGAVFMDADWWIEPPLYFLAPPLAASILQYRFNTLPVMKGLAKLFGFDAFGGAMAAWTAAYLGNPFGCCSAKGGYEDCLEHHISGDIAFSAWQYFSVTGDLGWLGSVGWPLLAGIADYHLGRVTPQPPMDPASVGNTSFHVVGVLPIDEWSVGSGCGSENPGVEDDAQMNGVVKASLLLAGAAARALGTITPRSLLWEAVGANVVLLYNTSHGHHDQFTSPTCPDGWGGSHYTPSHTVCPSDVEHLTYPLADVLNTSAADSRADAELFIPITCRENAGMTTPMHTVVWLGLGEEALAAAEFNRSMHAACYGPYNVRNEVDKHADVPGGHFDNTHFLTGDGGYLQALLNGYGGLRIVQGELKMLQPTLPESVGALTLRAISWHGCVMTVRVDGECETVSVASCAGGAGGGQPVKAAPTTGLCLADATGAFKNTVVVAGAPVCAPLNGSFAFPGRLTVGPC